MGRKFEVTGKAVIFTVDHAFKYTQTKFFRAVLDFMRLAQWNPIHKDNYFLNGSWFKDNCFAVKPDIDFDKSVAEIDEQFFSKYDFTPAMIKFLEERYHDDLRNSR